MTISLYNWGFINNWETKPPHEKCGDPISILLSNNKRSVIIYEIDSEYLIDLIKMYDIMSYERDGKFHIFLDIKGGRCRQR